MNNEDKVVGLFMSGIALVFSIIAILFSVIGFIYLSSSTNTDTSIHIHTDDGTGGFVPE